MLEIKTETLQMMVNKAVRGASNNKLVPLTSYMRVRVSPNAFSLLTTDGMNYLEVSTDIEGESLTAVVLADTFTRLVRKLTGATVKLSLTDKYLVVECNGTYKLELLLDDDGNPVDFTMPKEFDSLEGKEKLGELSRETISRILSSLRQSLAMDGTRSQYCCYRMGEEIIATDSSLISILNTKVFESARLISPECVNLLDAITTDVAECYKISDSSVVFVAGGDLLYTRLPVGIEKYNARAIKGFADEEFANHCTINVQAVLSTLERIALFVGVYDAGAVNFVFGADGVTVSSKNTSGVEQIEYETVDKEADYSCILDVDSAITVFKAQSSQVVDLYFDGEQTLKLVDGDLVTIIALMN